MDEDDDAGRTMVQQDTGNGVNGDPFVTASTRIHDQKRVEEERHEKPPLDCSLITTFDETVDPTRELTYGGEGRMREDSDRF